MLSSERFLEVEKGRLMCQDCNVNTKLCERYRCPWYDLRPSKEEREAYDAKLKEMIEAEADGRLVVLPCKAGDAIYIHDWRESPRINVYSGYVTDVSVGNKEISIQVKANGNSRFEQLLNWNGGSYSVESLGGDIFLSREQAEVALKERQGTQ